MILHRKKFSIKIAKAILKLVIAGVFIGILKEYDLIIAIILVLKIAYNLYDEVIKPEAHKNWILLIGMLITGTIGIIGESIGVYFGYWEYHEVDRAIPFWVPFAWMLAFHYLYKVEKTLIPHLSVKNQQNKIILAVILALILPAFGEVITIQLGVWTYYWPYQVLGVPLYAFLWLVAIHMSIYAILHFVAKKYDINDVVYR